jgi:hypothetical protein
MANSASAWNCNPHTHLHKLVDVKMLVGSDEVREEDSVPHSQPPADGVCRHRLELLALLAETGSVVRALPITSTAVAAAEKAAVML